MGRTRVRLRINALDAVVLVAVTVGVFAAALGGAYLGAEDAAPEPVERKYTYMETYQLTDRSYGPSGTLQRCVMVFKNLATGDVRLGPVHACDEGTPPRPLWERTNE